MLINIGPNHFNIERQWHQHFTDYFLIICEENRPDNLLLIFAKSARRMHYFILLFSCQQAKGRFTNDVGKHWKSYRIGPDHLLVHIVLYVLWMNGSITKSSKFVPGTVRFSEVVLSRMPCSWGVNVTKSQLCPPTIFVDM